MTKYIFKNFVLLLILFTWGCASRTPSSDYPKHPSFAISTTNTKLAKLLTSSIKTNNGKSGFLVLDSGGEAFLARLAIIEAAEKSIDLQYYSAHDDLTGELLVEAILRAADRGVRVRALLDDWTLNDFKEKVAAAVNTNPNIEVRVFNPLSTENQSVLSHLGNYITDFDRFTRRMHNKAMIVDNQVAVMGGRNLGDEYFDSGSDVNFRDLDVVAAGQITKKISQEFDRYWNSEEAYPIGALNIEKVSLEDIAEIRRKLKQHRQDILNSQKGKLIREDNLASIMKKGVRDLIWAKAEFAADDPSKVTKESDQTKSPPAAQVINLGNNARQEFIIISPYFVPLDKGVSWLCSLSGKGVKVVVLTNSLMSTDVVAVHSAYSKFREPLVKCGVDIYELKLADNEAKPRGNFGSSSSQNSLHAKVYIADRKDIVLGSFNLDPRSVKLNTEMVLVIHSHAIARQIIKTFEKVLTPASSFHIVPKNTLKNSDDSDDSLVWVTEESGEEGYYSSDPKAGLWRSIISHLISPIPLDGKL